MHTFIGFTGRAQSGKDTAAEYLKQNYDFYSLAFTDELRAMALDIDPPVGVDCDGEMWRYSDALKEYGYESCKERFPEFRRFLQRLGTDGVRDHLGAETWVDLSVSIAKSFNRNACWTDVRYPNEAAAIRDLGGSVIRLVRPEAGTGTNENEGHISETLMAEIEPDFIINNHGTVDQLHADLDTIIALALR